MKKLLVLSFVAVASVFLLSGNASAYPAASDVLPGHDGYEWVDVDYWTITDLTTGQEGSAMFTLTFEEAVYESDFGIFAKNNPNNKLEIFSGSEEPFPSSEFKNVYFKNDGGDWQISTNALDDDAWMDFDDEFGFYFGVHQDAGAGDPDYTFYTDSSLNDIDAGIQHIGMEWNGVDNAYFYLEDLPASEADWDYNDMTVHAHDVEPVPEPGTVLLLGAGLIGLVGLGRKRIK